MKRALLTILLLGSILLKVQAQKDTSSTTPKAQIKTQFKLSGSTLFLKNERLNRLLHTNTFFVPSIGVEIWDAKVGGYFEMSFFQVKNEGRGIDKDKNFIDSILMQFQLKAGVLQRIHISSDTYLRGKAGLSFITTNDDMLRKNDEGIALDFGIGLEFRASYGTGFFIDLGYLYRRSKTLGMLGGFRLEFGVKFGAGKKKKL